MTLAGTEAWLLLGVWSLLGLERLAELGINARHVRRLQAQGGVQAPGDGFPFLLAAQIVLLGGLVVEGLLIPWTHVGFWTWPLLAFALGAQALRYWCIRTLGVHWSIRVITVPRQPRIVSGPYRFLRHPNYVAVVTELLVIPLAFSAWGTTILASILNLVGLRIRIRREEAALAAA